MKRQRETTLNFNELITLRKPCEVVHRVFLVQIIEKTFKRKMGSNRPQWEILSFLIRGQ